MFAPVVLVMSLVSSVYASSECGKAVGETSSYASLSEFQLSPRHLAGGVVAPGDFLKAWSERGLGPVIPKPLKAEYYKSLLEFFVLHPERLEEIPNVEEDYIWRDLKNLNSYYLWMSKKAANFKKAPYTVRDVYEVHVGFAGAMNQLMNDLGLIDPDPVTTTLQTNAPLRRILRMFRDNEAVLRKELEKRLRRDELPPAEYSDEDLEDIKFSLSRLR